MVLGLGDTIESAHMGHPDFRVNGRIFATLGYPDAAWGMVTLTPDQQRVWVREHPDAFVPAKGKWGEQGATGVRLAVVEEEALGEALTLAWQNAMAKGPTRSKSTPRAGRPASTRSPGGRGRQKRPR